MRGSIYLPSIYFTPPFSLSISLLFLPPIGVCLLAYISNQSPASDVCGVKCIRLWFRRQEIKTGSPALSTRLFLPCVIIWRYISVLGLISFLHFTTKRTTAHCDILSPFKTPSSTTKPSTAQSNSLLPSLICLNTCNLPPAAEFQAMLCHSRGGSGECGELR